MVEKFNNIFLTRENLAFSMPLILTCLIYSYFKFIPLQIGIPILGVLFIAYLIREQFEKQRAKKLVNLDEKTIQDLIGEITKDDVKVDDGAVKKAKNKVKQRLAQERKVEENKNKSKKKKEKADDDDLDADDLATFAKKK